MNNIATSIEQSKELVRLGLDQKTADMSYTYFDESEPKLDLIPYMLNSRMAIPAWSLSALLEVMPKGTELVKMQNDSHALYWEVDYMFTGYEDSDPITAAYEMVCWLLEQGLVEKGGKDETE